MLFISGIALASNLAKRKMKADGYTKKILQGEGGINLQNEAQEAQSTHKRKRRLHALSKELIALAIRHDEALAILHNDETLLQVPFESSLIHSQKSFSKALLILHDPPNPNFHETEKKVLTPLILSGFLSQEQEEDKFSDLVAFASSMRRAVLPRVRQRQNRKKYRRTATPFLLATLFIACLWTLSNLRRLLLDFGFVDSCSTRACRLAEFELWEKINSWPLALEDCRNQECPSLQDRYTLYAMHTPVTSDWIPLEALEWKSEKQTDKKWKKTGESVVNRVVRDTVLAYQPQVSSLNILDVGCGLGGTLYSMLLFKGQLTYNGISPSLPEINQARQLSELHQLSSKKVHFERQSFDESINQSFNTMLAIESLSYSPNLNLTLKNLAKNLESRGILVIVDDIITPWAANEPNIEELRTTSARPSLLTNEEWKKSLSSNGFVIKETRDLSLEFDLPGVQNQRRNVRFAGFWKNLAVVAEKLYGKGDTMNQKANIRTIQLFQDYFTRLKTEELRGDGYCRAHLSYFMIICYRK